MEQKKPVDLVEFLNGLDIENLSLFIIDQGKEMQNLQSKINGIMQALQIADKILETKRSEKKEKDALVSNKIE